MAKNEKCLNSRKNDSGWFSPCWVIPPPANSHTHRLMVITLSVWQRPFGTTRLKIISVTWTNWPHVEPRGFIGVTFLLQRHFGVLSKNVIFSFCSGGPFSFQIEMLARTLHEGGHWRDASNSSAFHRGWQETVKQQEMEAQQEQQQLFSSGIGGSTGDSQSISFDWRLCSPQFWHTTCLIHQLTALLCCAFQTFTPSTCWIFTTLSCRKPFLLRKCGIITRIKQQMWNSFACLFLSIFGQAPIHCIVQILGKSKSVFWKVHTELAISWTWCFRTVWTEHTYVACQEWKTNLSIRNLLRPPPVTWAMIQMNSTTGGMFENILHTQPFCPVHALDAKNQISTNETTSADKTSDSSRTTVFWATTASKQLSELNPEYTNILKLLNPNSASASSSVTSLHATRVLFVTKWLGIALCC